MDLLWEKPVIEKPVFKKAIQIVKEVEISNNDVTEIQKEFAKERAV